MQRIKITIDGLSYSLITDQPEADIIAAANHLNALLHELKNASTVDRQQRTIIVALRLASELFQLENKLQSINSACQSIEACIDQELMQ